MFVIKGENSFFISVKKAMDEIDEKWMDYQGVLVVGSHDPKEIILDEVLERLRVAREEGIPTLGICMGMQFMAIEYARNVLGIKDATSEEIGQGTFVVKKLPGLRVGIKSLGHNMKKGEVDFESWFIEALRRDYESHWHNYFIDMKYFKNEWINGHTIGFVYVDEGKIKIPEYMAVIQEAPPHHFYVGVQFHPEYQSSQENPHPLLKGFIKYAKLAV